MMMRILIFAALTVVVILPASARSQTVTTRIVYFEVNRREVKKKYRVILYAGGKELEAKRTPDGFAFPDEFRSENVIDARIIFGKYDFTFAHLPLSWFGNEWRFIVSKKPFAEEFMVTPAESKTIKFVFYGGFGEIAIIGKVFKNRAPALESISTRKPD